MKKGMCNLWTSSRMVKFRFRTHTLLFSPLWLSSPRFRISFATHGNDCYLQLKTWKNRNQELSKSLTMRSNWRQVKNGSTTTKIKTETSFLSPTRMFKQQNEKGQVMHNSRYTSPATFVEHWASAHQYLPASPSLQTLSVATTPYFFWHICVLSCNLNSFSLLCTIFLCFCIF